MGILLIMQESPPTFRMGHRAGAESLLDPHQRGRAKSDLKRPQPPTPSTPAMSGADTAQWLSQSPSLPEGPPSAPQGLGGSQFLLTGLHEGGPPSPRKPQSCSILWGLSGPLVVGVEGGHTADVWPNGLGGWRGILSARISLLSPCLMIHGTPGLWIQTAGAWSLAPAGSPRQGHLNISLPHPAHTPLTSGKA